MTSSELRKAAVDNLDRVLNKGAFLNIVLSKISTSNTLSPQNKGYLIDTLSGIVTWKIAIDWIIDHLSSIQLKKIENRVLNYLRIGIFDLGFSEHTPQHVAIHELVESVKQYQDKRTAGYVNAILRAYLRTNKNIPYPPKKSNPVTYLATKYSYQEWMVKRWIKNFGFDNTEFICNYNNTQRNNFIRINFLKNDYQDFVDWLTAEDFITEEVDDFAHFYKVKKLALLLNSPWFAKGYFSIQSLTSSFPVIALRPEKGETIADFCAAPGGKSTFMAELMQNDGKIFAVDNKMNRVNLIKQSIARLSTKIIYPICADSSEAAFRKFDKILLDAPCSGFGTITNKPDIKYNRTFIDIADLAKLQIKLLRNASMYVKKGGTLVYSTCTIEPEENEDIIAQFLNKNNDFVLKPIDTLPERFSKQKAGMLTILPFEHNLDGSFIAKMERIN